MKIPFQGKVTVQDFRKALYLSLSKIQFWGSLLTVLLISFSYIYVVIIMPEIFQTIGFGILFPVLIVSSPLWIPFVQANSVNQKGSFYYNPVHGEITEAEISIDNGLTKGATLWQAYSSYKKFPDIVLLYQGKTGINVFTRALFLSENDWNSFLSLVASKLPLGK